MVNAGQKTPASTADFSERRSRISPSAHIPHSELQGGVSLVMSVSVQAVCCLPGRIVRLPQVSDPTTLTHTGVEADRTKGGHATRQRTSLEQ